MADGTANAPTSTRISALGDDDFPGLYRSSDKATTSAQATYLRLQKLYLGSLVLGSTAGSCTALGHKTLNLVLYTGIAIILVGGMLLLWVIRARQDEKAWFDGRAIAESVKTATWRYMMRGKPFQEDGGLDQRFVAGLREIRNARPNFGKHLAGVLDPTASAITNQMRLVRAASFDERKQLYFESRLRDQRLWYAGKARDHASHGSRWFWTIAMLQAIAAGFAIIQIASGGFPINLLSVVTTLAAVIVAWSNMKRHDELAQSYALASQELEELESIAAGVGTESDFSQFVEQVEEAISREHTMWCARRDVRLPRVINTGS